MNIKKYQGKKYLHTMFTLFNVAPSLMVLFCLGCVGCFGNIFISKECVTGLHVVRCGVPDESVVHGLGVYTKIWSDTVVQISPLCIWLSFLKAGSLETCWGTLRCCDPNIGQEPNIFISSTVKELLVYLELI